jgi:uncharacterized protein
LSQAIETISTSLETVIMLISFSVSNFRSFGEEQTLNLIASNRLTTHRNHCVPIADTGKQVLRSAVLYGANAAGKSNLVRAMVVAQQILSGGPVYGLEPFRFAPGSIAKPTSFEFRFLLGDQIFVYGFDVTIKKIIAEWLSVLRDDDEVVIFERDEKGGTGTGPKASRQFPDDPTMSETLDVLSRLPLTDTQLFLSRVRSLPESSQGRTLSSVISWLTSDLLILGAQYRASNILRRLHSDLAFRTFSSYFLQNVGTGIGDLDMEEITRDMNDFEKKFMPQWRKVGAPLGAILGKPDVDVEVKDDDPDHVIERRLLAEHELGEEHYRLPFSEESDGTQQLLHLMPILFPSNENKVVVIDELDRSLHPILCWEIIRFFSETCPGAHRQLIVTTHEAHLLNQDLLRRDEYWFVEKDSAQQSQLVSLSDFNIRNDLQVEKGYLQGRFGAIPVIGSMRNLEVLIREVTNAAQETPA